MATRTYTPIASITLGSSASSVTFSSIPQDYRDLVLVSTGACVGDTVISVNFNSDSSNIYSQVWMRGIGAFGTNTGTVTGTGTSLILSDMDADEKFQSVMQIMDYSATDKHTSLLIRGNQFNNVGNPVVEARAVRYGATTAITSIDLAGVAFDIAAGSTFALYGIAG